MSKVTVTATRHPDGVWILRVTCPYCHKAHTHGGGTGQQPSGGWRSPHCAGNNGTLAHYNIVVVSAMEQAEARILTSQPANIGTKNRV